MRTEKVRARLGGGKPGARDAEGAGAGSGFRFRTARSLGTRTARRRDPSWAWRDAKELVPRMRSGAGGGGAGASLRGLPGLRARFCGEGPLVTLDLGRFQFPPSSLSAEFRA